MEFGKVSPEQLDDVDWALAPLDPLSVSYLAGLRRADSSAAEFYIGAPAWGHKEWLGKIYPPQTKAADFLYHYSRQFNSIEFNTTHYRIPSREQTLKWLNQVPPRFRFCAKVFKEISHTRTGLTDVALLEQWWNFLATLEGHRGPSFMQLPPNFDYSMKSLLFRFLQSWPREFELALEFRHPSWFEQRHILPALVEYLQSREIGLVITDVAGRRDVSHSSVSAPFTLIRFIGNEMHRSDRTRAHAWSQRLLEWERAGLQRVYFIVHQPDDILLPEMARDVIRVFNTDRGVSVLKPLSDIDSGSDTTEPMLSFDL
ncbi:MAG: DUF72 domain-containing protein [Bdellovibrionaceae bacterium]|nr:DUF72 domain-containing protein [Pseudobdellovibrionaceae bacterium]